MTTYNEYDAATTNLVGSSFGAKLCATIAAQRPPARLVLISLSPYFAEDVPEFTPPIKEFVAEQNLEAFTETRFQDIVDGLIDCPTTLFIGQKASGAERERSLALQGHLRECQLFVVEGAVHSLTPAYLRGLEQYL